jgi:hypothetical protein
MTEQVQHVAIRATRLEPPGITCECPDNATGEGAPEWMYEPQELKARHHLAGKCPGDYNIKPYRRNGHVIYLCSCCDLPGDEEIKT